MRELKKMILQVSILRVAMCYGCYHGYGRLCESHTTVDNLRLSQLCSACVV